MGVIFQVGDEVRDLLCPFIVEKGGCPDLSQVQAMYSKASLGTITAQDFWCGMGINPALEDEYLGRHRLNEGVIEFMRTCQAARMEVWCLSNDVAEWSRKLRRRFELEKYLSGVVISGEVGLRKPNPTIYRMLVVKSGFRMGEIVFVDDNIQNLDAAAGMGLRTVLFGPLPKGIRTGHKVIEGLAELGKVINKSAGVGTDP
jgi:putative hydrolase of the HAD superfamily